MNRLTPHMLTSKTGMAISPHPLATAAGVDVLARGGNAVEATIAMSAVLTVVAPHFTGLGGDAFWLVADGTGGVRALSGIGQAARTRPALVGGGFAVRGPQSASTTAAAVDVWDRAWQWSRAWGGRFTWGDLLEAAVANAARGVPVSRSQAFWYEFRAAEQAAWPGFGAAFLPTGRTPVAGETMRLPQLAATLAHLARHGARDFYEGELAARVARGLQAAGSPLSAADLAATRAREEAPLRQPYRRVELLTLAPPTQGVSTLQAMALLERFDVAALGESSADHLHLMVEAIKQAFIERDRLVADPEFASVPLQQMLDPVHLDALARRVDLQHALPWPQPWRHGDTVYLAAADRAGRAVSALQTIYYDWGSGTVAGDTGILWHNRGAAFSPLAGHPNGWAPGKRPFHTLNPGMALEGGQVRWLYGTQGADGQPQTLVALLTRLIDFGLDPAQALARPRFLLGSTFSDVAHNLKIEADAGEDVLEALAQRGHLLRALPARSPLAGQAGIIDIGADGSFRGAHDPRGEGCAGAP
ncbi:MAG: gamma-glutamyltransferase family protein [Steroidobacteraceae bacterium]